MRSKHTIRAAVILWICCAAFAICGITPRLDFTSDVSQQQAAQLLRISQASSQQIGWTYTQGTTAKNITNATVTFTYGPSSKAWKVVSTGSVENAAAGTALVSLTPTQLNTNGTFLWRIDVFDADETLAYSYGTLVLIADPGSNVTNTFPTTTDEIYLYALTNVTAGTGISVTGSGRSRAIACTVTDTTYTNYLAGDTEAVVTGDARSGSNILSIGSTITRDTELSAASSGVYSASAQLGTNSFLGISAKAADSARLDGYSAESFSALPTSPNGTISIASAVTPDEPLAVTLDVATAYSNALVSAASNNAMAGATATFLPLAGGTITSGHILFSGTDSEHGGPYMVGGSVYGADDKSIGVSSASFFDNDHATYTWWVGRADTTLAPIPAGSIYSWLSVGTSAWILEGASGRILQTTNRAVIVGSAPYVADDGLSAVSLWRNGTEIGSVFAARTWDIDATIAATNQPSWSLCRKAARSSNVSITSVNAQSYYGTGTWMICQGASPSSWSTSGTYTASTTGDTTAVSITWTAGNNLYFVLLPLQCSDYPTNTIFPHAEGTY